MSKPNEASKSNDEELTPQEKEKRAARRFVFSNGLQNIGDEITGAKTVLPWVLSAGGAPGFFLAMLVPVRESGSMLPQAFITPWVLRHGNRVRLWVYGSLVQAGAAAAIAASAAALEGFALGLSVILALAILSLGRALCSIAGKDVQGRAISKGARGKVTGRAATVGGAVALTVGLGLSLLGGDASTRVLIALLCVSALAWAAAAVVFGGLDVPNEKKEPQASDGWKDCVELMRDNRDFRRFVIVRSLMLVTALSTSFLVAMGHEVGISAGVGAFLVASGLASLLGGRISGKWSDLSSKLVLVRGSLVASMVLVVVVLLNLLTDTATYSWIYPLAYFVIALAHTSIRVARKTYVVDMAEGTERTRYVAAANTLMGIILLGVGALTGLLATSGNNVSLGILAIMGVVGSLVARSMKDVSRPHD